LLDEIPSVGPAVASVILTFYDPQNYGILDIHVWEELFDGKSKNFCTIPNYLYLLEKLREIAKTHNLPVRTVEKALFKKNKEKSQGRRND